MNYLVAGLSSALMTGAAWSADTDAVTPGRSLLGWRSTSTANAYVQGYITPTSRELWIVATFSEAQVSRLRIGDAVEILVDAVPGSRLKGRVVSQITDDTSESTAPENRCMPVKIALDADRSVLDVLQPGMNAVVVSTHVGEPHRDSQIDSNSLRCR